MSSLDTMTPIDVDQESGLESGSSPDAAIAKPVSRFTRWYRSPLFNVIIVGLISFTQPGIWNALNSNRLWPF
jgi:hypothetical protein